MLRSCRSILRSEGASVAPVVALSLFGLIAAGGIAFDYARLASMDTELQNGADQAALAAASQLDGQTGACARAAAAANALLSNTTRFANDSSARAVDVANEGTCDATGVVQFYQSYNKANDTFGSAATNDSNARVVLVRVSPRQAVYAFTPVVGAIRSSSIRAEAVASLGSAICKVPPVMMCNPAEPENNTNVGFDFNPNEGDGLRLVIGDPDAPGNFGFLRVDAAGAKQVAKEIGYDNPPYGCMATNGVETEPGNMISVRAAFNTRFDITENGETTCPDGGTCSASRNARKDLVRGAGCALNNADDWHEASIPYRAPNTTPLSDTNKMADGNTYPEVMGYPRDLCHAWSLTGDCSGGIIGNGVWDIDAYFMVNYGWDHAKWIDETSLDPAAGRVTRYDIYQWELDNPTVLGSLDTQKTVSGGYVSYSSPVCRPSLEPNPPTTVDRRRISVAVVNCKAQKLKGHETNVQVRKWLDVFLVEPALARGNGPSQRSTNGDIYVEVIGVTGSGGGADNTVTRRDVPYLIR